MIDGLYQCVTGCQQDEFECKNGRCIAVNLICNGARDCSSGEDEANCCNLILFSVFYFIILFAAAIFGLFVQVWLALECIASDSTVCNVQLTALLDLFNSIKIDSNQVLSAS